MPITRPVEIEVEVEVEMKFGAQFAVKLKA
jgi:hypothetical protein